MHRRRTTRPALSTRPRWALLGLILLCSDPMDAIAVEPGRPPSRLLPAGGLTSYLEYDGLAAHEAAWKATAAHEILVETSAGAVIADVSRRALDRLFQAGGRGTMSGADLVAFQAHLARQGFALASYEEDGESSTVFVLNGFGEKDARDRFDRILRPLLSMAEGGPFPSLTRRGRELRGFGDWDVAGAKADARPVGDLLTPLPPSGLTWWTEGDRLVLVMGPTAGKLDRLLKPDRAKKDLPALHRARVMAVLDAIEEKKPTVATLPDLASASAEGRDLPDFEPTGLFFARGTEGRGWLDGLGESLGAVAGGSDEFTLFRVLDLGRADKVVGRWGFLGRSLASVARFEVPDAWRGPLISGGISRDRLPPIPKCMGAFAVGSLDPSRTIERIAPLRGMLIPSAAAILSAIEEAMSETTTPQLREDLTRHLGPTWSVYASPGGGQANPTVPTVLVGIDDAEAVDRALGALASAINDAVRKKVGAGPTSLVVERLPAPDRGYRLTSPDGRVPWLTGDLRPTALVGKSYLALAINPDLARAAIAAEAKPERRWEPTGELTQALGCLPANLSFLSVGNPRDSSWPEAIALLPATAPKFLGKFLHVDLAGDDGAARPPDFLDALGIPKAGPGPVPPKVDELRRLIHPSVLAATVEGRSFRLIGLEAMPLGCLGITAHFDPRGAMQIGVEVSPGR